MSADMPDEMKKWVTDAPPAGLGKTLDMVVEVQPQVREGATIYTVLFTDEQVHSYTQYSSVNQAVEQLTPQ